MGDEISKSDMIGLPNMLVDGIHGMQVYDGVITLNLTRRVFGVPGSQLEGPRDEAVVRLSMSVPAFLRIAAYMGEQVIEFEKEGIVTRIEAKENADGATQD